MKRTIRQFDFGWGGPPPPHGTSLSVLTGQSTPRPLDRVSSLKRVEVAVTAGAGTAFQLVFSGPAIPAAARGTDPLSRVADRFGRLDRVVCQLWIENRDLVLAEGVVTHRELTTAGPFGEWQMTVTGEDLSVLMDLDEKTVEHPQRNEAETVRKILDGYAWRGVGASVVAPRAADRPPQAERVPVQYGTDRAHLVALAKRCGYVFEVVTDGGSSVAYWGPKLRLKGMFPPLSLGAKDRNVRQLTHRHDALAAIRVDGLVQDAATGAVVPVRTPVPPGPATRSVLFPESGRTAAQAFARARGMVDSAPDAVVVTGETDTNWYPTVLVPGGLVPVRGAGFDVDGDYFVQRVVHVMESGGVHAQRFTLTQEGTR